MISQLPYLDMLKTTAADFHPPAYYTIIEILYKFFPATEVVTRSVSIIFYLISAYFAYKIGSIVRDRFLGYVCFALTLISPIFFTYALEARNYTLFALCATASMYYLMQLSKKVTRNDSIFFVVFSTLGIYTHYYMFFVLASQGLYLILLDRKIFFHLFKLYVLCGFLYLAWIPFLYKQVTAVSESYWIGSVNVRTHYEALLRILGGESQSVYRSLLFTGVLVILLAGIFKHLFSKKLEKYYFLIWLWALVPFALATLPGLSIFDFKLPFRPIFFWRYLIGASVPFAILISLCVFSLPKQIARTALASIFLVSVFINFQTFFRYPYTFRQAYEDKIVGQIKEGDKIVTILPSFAEVFYYRNYFNLEEHSLIVRPEGLVQSSGKSLLDAYVKNGTVTISENISGPYFEASTGPTITKVVSSE